MVSKCSVKNCKKRKDKDRNLKFYSLPTVVKHRGEEMKRLSEEQRMAWLEALGDVSQFQEFSIKICSSHFIKGKFQILTRGLGIEIQPLLCDFYSIYNSFLGKNAGF